jgi:hypothetical protein
MRGMQPISEIDTDYVAELVAEVLPDIQLRDDAYSIIVFVYATLTARRDVGNMSRGSRNSRCKQEQASAGNSRLHDL